MKIRISLMAWIVTVTFLVITLVAGVFLRSGGDSIFSMRDEKLIPATPHLGNVDLEWGFVTLEKIDALNLSENSEIEVVRDGLILGKLRIVSMEGSRAVADILADSLKEGCELRSGDIVR